MILNLFSREYDALTRFSFYLLLFRFSMEFIFLTKNFDLVLISIFWKRIKKINWIIQHIALLRLMISIFSMLTFVYDIHFLKIFTDLMSNGAARLCAIRDLWQFKTRNFLLI